MNTAVVRSCWEIFHDTMSDHELSKYVADPPYQPLTFESLGVQLGEDR